jgi:hypothetical protein
MSSFIEKGKRFFARLSPTIAVAATGEHTALLHFP